MPVNTFSVKETPVHHLRVVSTEGGYITFDLEGWDAGSLVYDTDTDTFNIELYAYPDGYQEVQIPLETMERILELLEPYRP